MAVVDVLNSVGEKVTQVDLADTVFNVPVKSSVLHEVVKMQLACRRAGSAAVKHRSDVSGSRRKLFRQKGTGRARRGDIKSPCSGEGEWFSGRIPGHMFTGFQKRIRRLALKMALSSKLQENNLVVLDRLELNQIKTKRFLEVVNALKVKNALIITDKKDEKLELSSRNLPDVKVLRCDGLNVYDILKYRSLVLLESSISDIERRLLA